MFEDVSSGFFCACCVATLRMVEHGIAWRAERGITRRPDQVIIGMTISLGVLGLSTGLAFITGNIVRGGLYLIGAACAFAAAYLEWRSGKPPRRRKRARQSILAPNHG
jgi:hypothetical protein